VEEVFELHEGGESYRAIADEMKTRHGVEVSHNAVFSFVRTHAPEYGRRPRFYDGIPDARRQELLGAIKAIWTHDSAAIEGNTLDLGDTMLVLQYGLTIAGKSLKEHQEIFGHARAVEKIYSYTDRGHFTEDDIFDLHRTVVTEEVHDIYKPVGAWKREPNGTYGKGPDGKTIYMAYADPDDVPALMKAWLADFNNSFADGRLPPGRAAAIYARLHMGFVRIHPFFDGNGRLARLLANLPVLWGGLPPFVVPSEHRADYIRLLGSYQQALGSLKPGMPLAPARSELVDFAELLLDSSQQIRALVAAATDQSSKVAYE